MVGAAILDERPGLAARCLAAQRGAAMTEPLQWEFPGGKVESGEAPREALVREIREELALEIEVGEILGRGSVVRGTGHGARRIVLDVYIARIRSGTVRLAEHRAWRWLEADAVPGLDWAEADIPVLAALVERLRGGDVGT